MINTHKLKALIEYVLERDYDSRENDQILIFNVLKELGFDLDLSNEYIKTMPTFEIITRIRRKIQHEEGKFQPKDEDVIKKRMDMSEKMRKSMGKQAYYDNVMDELDELGRIRKPLTNVK